MRDGQERRTLDTRVCLTALIAAICLLSLLALRVGSAKFTVRQILSSLLDASSPIRAIIIDIRLPRVILSILIGMCLTAAGTILQAVMHNPLADPGVIGVSSGASVVATAVFLIMPAASRSVPLFAFAGALAACAAIYSMAWRGGADPIRIVLAGVAVNAMLGGATSFLMLMNADDLQGVLAWMNGSLSAKSWSQVRVMAAYGSIGILCSALSVKSLNALQLGDEVARNLGIRVGRTRVVLSGIAAYLAASTVSVAGIIGFVGLIVPHVARMAVGANHKRMLPAAMLLGACVVLLADLTGRTVVAPVEIPVGIVMSILGGPFFLYLLRRRKRTGM
ncbi:MAG: iron ABC transporter permease [Oscillospiraceae bacterium]|jgi:iron complex transport system permease protein|nr:iron ABC transporter permease [Oscillospiraceae bacterium]